MRQSGAGALNTLYAEDGAVFLAQALDTTPLDNLTRTYAGYLHVVPRMLGEAAAAGPLEVADSVLSGGAALCVALMSVIVFTASAAHLRSRTIRLALASSMILLPTAQVEVFNNVANLHWFLIFTSFWVLLWRPQSRWGWVVGTLVLLLSGLSDPLTVVLAPVVLARLFVLPGVRDRLFVVAWAAGLLLQFAAVALGEEQRELPLTANPAKIAGWYLLSVVGRGVLGSRWLADLGSPVTWAASLLVLATLVYLLVSNTGQGGLRGYPLPVMATGVSILMFVVPVGLTGWNSPRYSAGPVLLLLSALAGAIDSSIGSPGRRGKAAWLLLVVGAAVWTANFQVESQRTQGPVWDQELASGRQNCERTAGKTVAIPITPPGWEVAISCELLLGQPLGSGLQRSSTVQIIAPRGP
ncbi:MAG: hypothetical protein ACT4OM_07220 [Actinomycetota bacterium]